ncbi:serine/threonine-protein kinase [Propionibacterium freudenreichii]|uniref:serine/threonine-protein kinase n=1 Tax=Propionibacterium freudenreichii TaxID=1744 RepID=UPI000BC30A3E|nr:serine/threonine-protein kinase [Propionibacterium freudenreichii]MDK9593465.1 protein kinase [Propionibacterium freudenreichii]WFF33275.1 protein kinase [Propionibacterium freudenreichii]WFF35507.1 protein kinase [Propionibacterium freudenreichii]SBN53735.1 Hypothetical protein PFR_JS8_2170 [Propionibacterium freudenreichii]
MTQDNSGSAEKPFRLGTNYQVETPLGHGVVGTTWRGTGAGGAELAFTVLNKRFASNPQVVRHLLAQRPVLATVRGDHVVPVVDMVADSDVVAVVSPYIKGTDLRSRLDDEGTLPPAEACRIISETAQGLAMLHATGLTHRDVKPSNILLDDTQQPASAKVTDYAVGGIVEEWAGGGHSAVLASTPAYLSPEVIAGDPVTVQSDMYALGVVLYESLCGVTPFAPLQPEGTMQAILTLDPGRPRGVDDALWEVLSMLLNRDPRQRGSADALSWRLSELQNALADAPKLPKLDVSPSPTPLPQVMAFPGAAPTTAPQIVGQVPAPNQPGPNQLGPNQPGPNQVGGGQPGAQGAGFQGPAAGVLAAGAVIGAAAAAVPTQQAAAQPTQAASGPSDAGQVAGGQTAAGQAGPAQGQGGQGQPVQGQPGQDQSGQGAQGQPLQGQPAQGQPAQGQPGQQPSPQSGAAGQVPGQPAADQPAPHQGAASQPVPHQVAASQPGGAPQGAPAQQPTAVFAAQQAPTQELPAQAAAQMGGAQTPPPVPPAPQRAHPEPQRGQPLRRRPKFIVGLVLVIVIGLAAAAAIAVAVTRLNSSSSSSSASQSSVTPTPSETPTPTPTPTLTPTPEVWPPDANAVICTSGGTMAVKRGTTYCTFGTTVQQALAAGTLTAPSAAPGAAGTPATGTTPAAGGPTVSLRNTQTGTSVAVSCTSGATITTCSGNDGSVVWVRR